MGLHFVRVLVLLKITSPCTNHTVHQRSNKAKSGSAGQADFLAGQVNFKVHLPNV